MAGPSVLFVCTGNICRSPSAEGVFKSMAAQKGLDMQVDSAGTHAYHIGDAPDPRSQAAAMSRDIDISDQRARKVSAGDFDAFDYILVMDSSHYATLLTLQSEGSRAKLDYLMAYAPSADGTPQAPLDVPDPYYGGGDGFEYVLDLIELAAEGFFDHLYKTKNTT